MNTRTPKEYQRRGECTQLRQVMRNIQSAKSSQVSIGVTVKEAIIIPENLEGRAPTSEAQPRIHNMKDIDREGRMHNMGWWKKTLNLNTRRILPQNSSQCSLHQHSLDAMITRRETQEA